MTHFQMTFNFIDRDYQFYNLVAKAVYLHAIKNTPILGSTLIPWQQEQPLFIDRVSSSFFFCNILLPVRFLHLTHNNLIECNVLQFRPFTSVHTRQKLLSECKTLPNIAGQPLILVWACMPQLTLLFQVSQKKTKLVIYKWRFGPCVNTVGKHSQPLIFRFHIYHNKGDLHSW